MTATSSTNSTIGKALSAYAPSSLTRRLLGVGGFVLLTERVRSMKIYVDVWSLERNRAYEVEVEMGQVKLVARSGGAPSSLTLTFNPDEAADCAEKMLKAARQAEEQMLEAEARKADFAPLPELEPVNVSLREMEAE